MTTPGLAQSYLSYWYNEENGLPSSTVYDIEQDAEGNIWFATRAGIVRYDGLHWKTFGVKDGLGGRHFEDLFVSSDGSIWGISAYGPPFLVRFKDGDWTSPAEQHILEGEIKSFSRVCVLERGGFRKVVISSTGGLLVWDGESWQSLDVSDGLPGWSVRDMIFYENQVYGVTDNGLFLFDGNRINTSLNNLIDEDFRNLRGIALEPGEGAEPELWLVGHDWVGRIRDGVFEVLGSIALNNRSPIRVLPDLGGGVFAGNRTGLFHFRDGHASYFGPQNGLISHGGRSLFRDREKNLWIATDRGVSKLPSMRFANYYRAHGLLEDEISALIEWEPGVWLAGHNQGLSYFDCIETKTVVLSEPGSGANNRVMDFAHGPDGAMWAAVSQLGLAKIDRNLGLTFYDSNEEENMDALLILPDGQIWVSGRSIYTLKDEKLVLEMPKVKARRFMHHSDGRIFAATTSGLLSYDGNWQHWDDGGARLRIYNMLEDRRERLFLGALEGLFYMEDSRIKPFIRNGIHIDRPVFLLLEDAEGRVWVGTDRGVSVIGEKDIVFYTPDHGFAGNETNRDAGWLDSTGKVWFGTDRGLSLYQEGFDFGGIPPPLVHIDRVEVNNSTLTDFSESLSHDRNNLLFRFRGISFINENEIAYQAKLEGHDSEWISGDEPTDNVLRYTNLPPGEYRFMVRASNIHGVWSDVVVSDLIHIKKPFWLTLWFLVLVLFVLAFLTYTVSDYLSSKRYSKVLALQVRERTRALEKKMKEHQQAEAEIQALNEDLEERVKERTLELENIQKDLVEAAHRAGMAEISSAMIHNVGNILNSVSTSCYFIRNTLESSSIDALQKANSLLARHIDNPEQFVAENPKAKPLLHFFLALGDRLAGERDKLNQHALLLEEKVDTIKDVVAQQHNYASGVFQSERVQLAGMVETAITILETSLEERGIRLVTHFGDAPDVQLQKTKTVHTLVNLIKNASQSITSHGGPEKQITITIQSLQDWVELRIEDTGEGIDLDNQSKIFSHGFTTKKEGLGFGLHSSANAMHAMGGLIRVESPGRGKGAIFILHFPVGDGQPGECAQ